MLFNYVELLLLYQEDSISDEPVKLQPSALFNLDSVVQSHKCNMDFYIKIARQFLRVGKKNKALSHSASLDLSAQFLAIDLGLKPAVLYDVNGASPIQVHHFMNALQEEGFVSSTLRTVVIGGNIFIVNLDKIIVHLKELLLRHSLVVIDVCPSQVQPVAFDITLGGIKDMIKAMLDYFIKESMNQERNSILEIGEDLIQKWNLCTLFGVLLGYPATYWFDQDKGFDNCLSLVPLLVTKVSLTWQTGDGQHQFCLFSFSIPEVLWTQAKATFESWTQNLQQQFNKQTALSELNISQTHVSLPAVTL
ncbi:UPF0739 protein C1orf74 homolog [Sardina pilchardus]|uniref:UPF0739 protein C1orf74 homolog n=1 Tax=Sardina pilchardus TaxID=27697 RepID=UPI002E1628AF